MLTVGVAPGTTTLQLGDVYQGVAAKSINWIPARPCPPEEKRWMIYDRDNIDRPWAHPNGFKGLGELAPFSWSTMSPAAKFWMVASTVSMALCVYHGYKRNNSVGWALGWGLFGTVAPIVAPVVAYAQGFGVAKKGA